MFGCNQSTTTALQSSNDLMRAHAGISAMPSSYGLVATDPLSQMQGRSSAAIVNSTALALTATLSDDTMAGAYNLGTLTTSLTGDGTTAIA